MKANNEKTESRHSDLDAHGTFRWKVIRAGTFSHERVSADRILLSTRSSLPQKNLAFLLQRTDLVVLKSTKLTGLSLKVACRLHERNSEP